MISFSLFFKREDEIETNTSADLMSERKKEKRERESGGGNRREKDGTGCR